MVMTKRRTAIFSAGLLVALAGLNPVQADVPAALDRVPANAGMVIAVKDMQGIKTRVEALAKKLNAPIDEPGDDNPLNMANKLLGTEGLNKNGSLAIAMLPDETGQVNFEAPEEEQRIVMVVPVADYAKFATALGATQTTGITSIKVDDHPAFIKDIGNGYAAMGVAKDAVEKFEGKGGNAAAHTRNIGKSGNQIADNSDVIVVVAFAAFKDKIDEGMTAFRDNAQGMAQMAGPQGEQMLGMITMMTGIADAISRDGQVGIMGFGLGEAGISFDFGAQFKEGSPSAKFLSGSNNSASYLARVPNQPFYMAMAMDMTNPGVKQFYRDMEKAQKDNPMGGIGFGNMAKNIDKTNGMAFCIGANKAGFMGFLANTVTFISTGDPKGYINAVATDMQKLNGQEVEGIKFTIDHQPAAQEVAGVKADTWSMKMDLAEDNPQAGSVMMMQQMFFGPDGLQGMMAPVDNGVVMTLSQNTPLFTSAVEAAKAGNGLGTNEQIKKVQQSLPKDSVGQMYLGTKSIMDAIKGFMAMQGMGADLVVPANVSPVGLATSMDAGGFDFRIFVPTDVVTAVADAAKAMEAEGEGEDEMDEPADEEGKPAAPRF